MDLHKKRHIIQELVEIARKAEEFDQAKAQPKRLKEANGPFILSDQTLSHYRQVEKLLLTEENWGAKFSEQYIRGAIDNLLSNLPKLANKEDVEPIFRPTPTRSEHVFRRTHRLPSSFRSEYGHSFS